MSFPVTYYCPHCEALVELERDGYLADKAVTPFPFEGWNYVAPDDPFEDRDDVDGVVFTCGADGLLVDNAESGCGERFYLSFVRFENGIEIDPRTPTEQVELGERPVRSRSGGPAGPTGPRGPSGSPGPNDPGGFW